MHESIILSAIYGTTAPPARTAFRRSGHPSDVCAWPFVGRSLRQSAAACAVGQRHYFVPNGEQRAVEWHDRDRGNGHRERHDRHTDYTAADERDRHTRHPRHDHAGQPAGSGHAGPERHARVVHHDDRQDRTERGAHQQRPGPREVRGR